MPAINHLALVHPAVGHLAVQVQTKPGAVSNQVVHESLTGAVVFIDAVAGGVEDDRG